MFVLNINAVYDIDLLHRIEPDNRKQGTSVQKTNKTNKTAVAAVKRDDVNERGAKNTM